jgi:UDP:flavonoid glycosyltransferase YjiC (YdhE family)
MRAVLAVDGTRGDVHPMLALAASLRSRGHDVLVCAPPDFRDAAESQRLPFHAVGRDVRAYLVREAEALHGNTLTMLDAGQRYFLDNLADQIRELCEVASGADLVLAAGTQLGAFSAAERAGADYRLVLYDPSLLRSALQPPAFLPYASLPRWLTRLSWAALVGFMSRRLLPSINRERERLGLGAVRDLYPRLLGDRPVLAAEELLAPAPADVAGVQTIGCLHPFREAPLPEKLEAFLAGGEPPVYVGFGSMTDPDPAASTRLVLDAVARAGVRALISEGWAGLGGIALPSDVMRIGAVDHASLFQRVAAVIHHGGAGTTTMAARAGAPQILVPHVLDQFHWSRRIEKLGLGPPCLPRRRLTAAKLTTAIRSVLDNEVVTERAAEIASRLRDAMRARPEPADVLA